MTLSLHRRAQRLERHLSRQAPHVALRRRHSRRAVASSEQSLIHVREVVRAHAQGAPGAGAQQTVAGDECAFGVCTYMTRELPLWFENIGKTAKIADRVRVTPLAERVATSPSSA